MGDSHEDGSVGYTGVHRAMTGSILKSRVDHKENGVLATSQKPWGMEFEDTFKDGVFWKEWNVGTRVR